MKNLKYLITGGWGRLGSELKDKIDAVAPTKTEMDILNPKAITIQLTNNEVDTILHLAAICDVRQAEKEKLQTYNVNVHGTANLAEAAKKFGKKLIYISTDYIFPGDTGNYSEKDEPSPTNWYGFTKYAGELEIQQQTQNYLIIRTSFRPNVWPFPTAYDDVFTSGDYVDVIADEILTALKLDISGIIHIGTSKKTLFELAKQRNPEIKPEHAPKEILKRKDLDISLWGSIKNSNNKK